MKGFIKVCLMAALILVGAGLALTISGVILTDADQVARSVDSVTGGRVNFDIDPSDGRFEIAYGDYSTTDLRNAVGKILDHKIYDVADDGAIYDEAQELLSGDVESQCFPGADVQRLDLDAGGCSIQVLLSEDANYYVAAKSIEKLQAYVSGETLYVKSTRSGKLSGGEIKNAVILLYVPEETYLKEADIQVGAGLLELEELNAKKLHIELGAGEIVYHNCVGDELEINVGAGDLNIENMSVSGLECKAGMGNITLAGELTGNAKVECSMGNITMNLAGEEADFNYKLESSLGNIRLNGEELKGLAAERKIDNEAPYTIKLECSMGNINLNFD